MERLAISIKTFEMTDQKLFASVSGDRNPMHLDPVLARRTQAAAPVVHGIHLLLWSLDALALSRSDLPSVNNIRTQFSRFVYLGESVEALLTQSGPSAVRLAIYADGMPTSWAAVNFGDVKPCLAAVASETSEWIPSPAAALELDFAQMGGRSGRLAFATSPEAVAKMFPAAADWLGGRRIAALAACTNLVGMVCPGLHSIFGGLSVDLSAESDPQDVLGFRVISTDSRFRLVRQEIAGGGITGTLDSFARMPPTPQLRMEKVAARVDPSEFAGCVTLVVGGSRGLGELTAKLLAAGGASVIITYRTGEADAKRVALEIRKGGGVCAVVPFDACMPATAQLAHLPEAPTHAYYFATPMIARRKAEVFVLERFKEMLDVYVYGFWRLCTALRARRHDLSAFYPSSIFVEERPKEMAEYAMAKAAGEVLCSEITASMAPMHITVSRLPRLLTDQTAAIMGMQTVYDPLETLLPLVRQVQSWPRVGTGPARG